MKVLAYTGARWGYLLFAAALAACGGGGTSCDPPDETLRIVNTARAGGAWCGPSAPPLVLDDRLQRAAQIFADDLAAHQIDAGHVGSDGSLLWQRLARVGHFAPAGENTAAGTPSAADTVAAFRDSPAHCTTLMRPEARRAGLACAESAGRSYWVQLISM